VVEPTSKMPSAPRETSPPKDFPDPLLRFLAGPCNDELHVSSFLVGKEQDMMVLEAGKVASLVVGRCLLTSAEEPCDAPRQESPT
jgi:hypothetical protein